MRGPTSIPIQVPDKGMVVNVPPHRAPPDSLIGGNNVYVDIDGKLKVRQGYNPVPADGSGLNPTDIPIGLINFHDAVTGDYITVMQGLSTWQVFLGTGDWINITNAAFPTTGNIDLRGQFTVLFQGGNSVVYGVNGVNQMRSWQQGQATYQAVPAAPTTSRDLDTIANRVVTVAPTSSGTFFPYRVQWSAINDGTTWPIGAEADLQGASHDMDYIIAIKALNRLSAAIYRENSVWIMTAIPGTDQTAFDFELAPNATGINGPVNPQCVVAVNGVHYFYGNDNRIWTFDGISAYPISQTIDPAVQAIADNVYNGRFSAAYLPNKRQIWFFFVPTIPPQAPYVR